MEKETNYQNFVNGLQGASQKEIQGLQISPSNYDVGSNPLNTKELLLEGNTKKTSSKDTKSKIRKVGSQLMKNAQKNNEFSNHDLLEERKFENGEGDADSRQENIQRMKSFLEVDSNDNDKIRRKSFAPADKFQQIVALKHAMKKKHEDVDTNLNRTHSNVKDAEDGAQGGEKKRNKKKKKNMTSMINPSLMQSDDPLAKRSKKNKFKTMDAADINNFKYNENSGKYMKIVKTLITAFYVLRLIRMVKQSSSWFKVHTLKRKQFQIINDQSTHYNYYYYRDFFFQDIPSIFDKFRQNAKKRWHDFKVKLGSSKYILENSVTDVVPLMPTSHFKIVLDIIIMLALIFQVLWIPVRIGFELTDQDFSSTFQFFHTYIIVLFFIIEILLIKTNTAVYHDGKIICDRYSVIGLYVKGTFMTDLITTFSLITARLLDEDYISLIFLARYSDILKIYENIEVTFQFRDKFAAWSRLTQLIGLVFCACHYFASAFHKLGIYELRNPVDEKIWLQPTVDLPWTDRYVNSLYWAIITMTTVGYGDVIPYNTTEKVFVIIIALISSVIFAYSMNNIGEILKELGLRQAAFRQKMLNLNFYMEKRDLNEELKMKVIKYFQYLNNERNDADEEGSDLVNTLLAPSLREEVLKDIYGQIIRSKKLFRLIFSNNFIDELALKMKEKIIGPEELIYKEGEHGDKIYFIVRGKVEMFLNIEQYNSPHISISHLGSGETFGEYEFFNNMQREMAARSIGVTSLAYILLEDFNNLLLNFPSDYEQIKVIQHNFKNCGVKKGLDIQCLSCGKYDHSIINCPMINVCPNKEKLINKVKQIDQDKQERNQETLPRSRNKSKSALKQYSVGDEKAKKLMTNLKINEEQEKKKEQLLELMMEGDSSSAAEVDEEEIQDYSYIEEEEYSKNGSGNEERRDLSADGELSAIQPIFQSQKDNNLKDPIKIPDFNQLNDNSNQIQKNSKDKINDQRITNNFQISEARTPNNYQISLQESQQIQNVMIFKKDQDLNKQINTDKFKQLSSTIEQNIIKITDQLQKNTKFNKNSPLEFSNFKPKKKQESDLNSKSEITEPKRKSKTIKFNNFEFKDQQNIEMSRFQDIKLKKNTLNHAPIVESQKLREEEDGEHQEEVYHLNYEKPDSIFGMVKEIPEVIFNSFDAMKQFSFFLPHNNYNSVLEQIEEQRLNGETYKTIKKFIKKKIKNSLLADSKVHAIAY